MKKCRHKKKLALYIHIPFCIKKCSYCDFLSMPASEQEKERYIHKMIEEILFWRERVEDSYEIHSIFIGGGTPTCLSPELLFRLGETLDRTFSLAEGLEYTIEANPGTISKALLPVLKEIGINRVSLGLQSSDPLELKKLGRIHTYEDFLRSYTLLREEGFSNINVDLMSALPGQTLESYQRTLRTVAGLKPEHISSYSLIIEEGTPFFEWARQGMSLPDEDTDREMYDFTGRYLHEQGYIRYEISNYAKKGKECRHNLTYWEMDEYLGIGLGASSCFQGERFRNEADLQTYCFQAVKDSVGGEERHLLSKKEEMEEYVFLGLRKMEGISASAYQRRFSEDFFTIYESQIARLFSQGLLKIEHDHDRISLTNRGIDVSNIVLAEFLLEEGIK